MEKPPLKSKGNKILKLLPKGTSFAIRNPPYSPGRDKGHAARKGFSGPLFSRVPAEARRRPSGRGFETPEPTSPKVSCIGQIKHKTKVCRPSKAPPPVREERKPRFSFVRMFSGRARRGSRPSAAAEKPPPVPGPAPPLGQLRRFASGRDALANFDWKGSRVSDDSGEDYSEFYSHDFNDDDDDEDVRIPHSAPIVVGGGGGGGRVASETRKEVNLWKRRTMSPPSPLHLE